MKNTKAPILFQVILLLFSFQILFVKFLVNTPLQPYSSPKRDAVPINKKITPLRNFPNDNILKLLTINVATDYTIKLGKTNKPHLFLFLYIHILEECDVNNENINNNKPIIKDIILKSIFTASLPRILK